MKVAEFDYHLPEELIAQHPLEKRDESRLMVLDRENKEISHKIFKDVIDYLNPGDCLVINNTKVIPARLYGKKVNPDGEGADVEFLLIQNLGNDIWEVLVKPGKKLKEGTKVMFGDILQAEILEALPNENRKVKFTYEGIFNEILAEIGLMPLPPYITEKL
ncbi:MAG: S-adenosylmethionine:tRNA ribosyltransferase-isomerase, partial [Oscillospiraceae bacterium]|nr:S-adenosylmethionine:tRNA ribosyltransferase-isomerase [Oscillospiraceae bacterium]